MIRHRERRFKRPWLIAVSLALVTAGCIFDSDPVEPGFPSSLYATISFQSIGDPVLCKCMSGSELALIASGSSLGVVDVQTGQITAVLELAIEIDDIADSEAGGYAWVLADSLLYPVDLTGPSPGDPVRLGGAGSFVCVLPSEDQALVAMNDDSLASVDLVTMQVITLEEPQVAGCQGIAYGGDGTFFAALGFDGAIAGYHTGTWEEFGRVSLPGDVIDLFPGPSGYVCAIVQGSNELWFIRTSDCKLYSMVTFPQTPVAAASMPDGFFAYGACGGIGLLVVAESGQIELKTMEFGIPSSIDITPDGSRAVLCSVDDRLVHILMK